MAKAETVTEIGKSTSIGKTSVANETEGILTVAKVGHSPTENMNDYKSDIKMRFDEIAEKYDKDRRNLLPCYDDFYSIPLNVLKEIHPRLIKLLI